MVEDTKKINKTILHIGRMRTGKFNRGDSVEASIDVLNRNLIRANHTVTHLLHAALRKVLGEHVKQAGSLVAPERMRFDFAHFNALTGDELREVESLVTLILTGRTKSLPNALPSSSLAEVSAASSMSASTTQAPSPRRRRAVARPMPPAPPVTRAI